ncbi:TlyA family RNA methyltransferase [Breoghania sp.]|uniref:TlyA family RNA methyltransferase n=1 Tax=Breoghania sp. TaxID=2065378 RepID=UPI003204DB94
MRDVVLRGHVTVDGKPAAKPGQTVSGDAEVAIDNPVSRAALKLVAGFDASSFDVTDCHCLDIGASTGGFTQMLLERGAASVDAIDVGHGQLYASLVDHPRIRSLEGINARALANEHLRAEPEIVMSDVSFISLRFALPPALALAAPGVFLVKPQFKAGEGGLVDPSVAEEVAEGIRVWLSGHTGWQLHGMTTSPIKGSDGNAEYLLGVVKDG